MMIKIGFVAAGCCTMIGCGRAPGVDATRNERTAQPPSSRRGSPASARAFDLVPLPPARFPTPGALPTLTFYTPHITKGSRFEVKDLDVIVKHASFVARNGDRLPARAEETAMSRHPELGHYFTVMPSQPLLPNNEYALQIVEDDAIRVVAPARYHSTRDGRTTYQVDLSTDADATPMTVAPSQ